MKNNRIFYFISLFAFSAFWACSGSGDENQLIDDESVIQEIQLDDTKIPQQFYQLPSPVEMFMFMWEDGAPFYNTHLNPIENVDKYVDSKKKSLNLGIYSADLAYCTVYDKNQETMNLFSATKKLAEDLGLTEGFDQSILERIDKNIENSDSLYRITSDSYSKTLTFLQSQGRTEVLPYIVYGGWLESLYIATQTVKKFNPESGIAERINDQGLLLENLIEFFNAIKVSDAYADTILKDLNSLDLLFKKSAESEDGLMTKEVYGEVKEQVKTLRNQIVK
ncbi:MAG: hypothetical protein JXR60_04220 [Bacteroidales bacterium]|nr:hypothetical protein [Bacteroidales bacterium]